MPSNLGEGSARDATRDLSDAEEDEADRAEAAVCGSAGDAAIAVENEYEAAASVDGHVVTTVE